MKENEPDTHEIHLDAVLAEFLRRGDEGSKIDRDAFLAKHPDLADELRSLLEAADLIESMAGPQSSEFSPLTSMGLDSTLPPNTVAGFESGDSSQGLSDKYALNDQTLPHASSIRLRQSFSSLPGVTEHGPKLPCQFGDYILERVLGRGGMGVVYIGRQIQLERQVAIKMIRSGCLASEDEVARFYAEARSAARLDHPNIVTVYQCGESDGHHFFSMDFVPGTDLARKLSEGPLPGPVAARYVRDVALAIAYAHQRGVLHRDLKPANVLIDERDQVVVTDFGLAKMIGSDAGLTRSGAALGTPSYMSPEQAAGRNDEQNVATDVYSLGAILFSLLTGRPPFQADSVVQTIMQVIHRPAPMVRQIRKDVNSDLETIVSKCLQKQAQRRYPSAQAVADDLDRFLTHQPIMARPLKRIQKAWYWLQGIPLVSALTGHRHLESTPAHRWVQRSLVISLILAPILWISLQLTDAWMANNAMPSRLVIAAGNPEGMYHEVASLLASNIELSARSAPIVMSTEGSIENLRKLLSGEAHLGMLQSSSVRSAKIGIVAPLYYEAVHVLIRRELDTKSLNDLRGKRIAMGTPNSGTRQASLLLFSQLGLSENDFQVKDVELNALQHAKDIDAAIIVIKVGQPWLKQLLAEGPFRLTPIPNAMAISLDEPTFRAIEVSTADYPEAHLEAPVSTLATTAFLVARMDASARLIRTTLDCLYPDGSPIPGVLTAAQASHWQGLPWHPIARDYFENLYRSE